MKLTSRQWRWLRMFVEISLLLCSTVVYGIFLTFLLASPLAPIGIAFAISLIGLWDAVLTDKSKWLKRKISYTVYIIFGLPAIIMSLILAAVITLKSLSTGQIDMLPMVIALASPPILGIIKYFEFNSVLEKEKQEKTHATDPVRE